MKGDIQPNVVFLTAILFGVLVIGASYYLYQWQEGHRQALPSVPPTATASLPSPQVTATPTATVTPPDAYDIFGGSTFWTTVTGYLVTRKERVFGEPVERAYLAITDFADPLLRERILAGIKRGNTVNTIDGEEVLFSLGCLEDGTISAQQYGVRPYLNPATESAILQSSADEPVRLELRFGEHQGSDCTCCNLAHQIRLVAAD